MTDLLSRLQAAFGDGYVVAVWRNADPELRWHTQEAKAALLRLGVVPVQ